MEKFPSQSSSEYELSFLDNLIIPQTLSEYKRSGFVLFSFTSLSSPGHGLGQIRICFKLLISVQFLHLLDNVALIHKLLCYVFFSYHCNCFNQTESSILLIFKTFNHVL